MKEKCHVIRARIFDRGKHANRRYFSYSNSWFASLSLFLADAAGAGCGAVSNSGHRRPGKQATHVGWRGFQLRPRLLFGGFTRSTRLWKSHECLESKAIPRDAHGPRRKTNSVASDLRPDPTGEEARSRCFPQQNDAGIARSGTPPAQAPRKAGGQLCTRTSVTS